MTLIERIKALNWFTLVQELKSILPQLISETPEPTYKVYRALLKRVDTLNEPPLVYSLLENTLGFTPEWTYDNPGNYYISNVLFTKAKTSVLLGTLDALSDQAYPLSNVYDGAVYLSTYNFLDTEFADFGWGNVSPLLIEIKVDN